MRDAETHSQRDGGARSSVTHWLAEGAVLTSNQPVINKGLLCAWPALDYPDYPDKGHV